MTLENIDFTISINYLILTILIILGIGYTYFSYRFTIPATSNSIKALLIFLRALALSLLIIIIFEPILIINYLQKNSPINLLLIDNSSSIVNKDSLMRSENVNQFITDYKNKVNEHIKIGTFGKDIKFLNNIEKINLPFNETSTNFEKIAPFIHSLKENIASITLVSDGIITEGSNSINDLERLNIPIFTIAVGDTTRQSDISIAKVDFNKRIYKNTKTEINAVVSNLNFANKNVLVTLFDKSGLISQKQIKLDEFGINNISFEYEAIEIGKQNLSLKVSELKNEITYENNKFPFVIEVLDDKTNVLLISSSPSNDLSFIIQSLSKNENIRLNKIIQIGDDKFSDNVKDAKIIDSADVIIMLNFPSNKTPQNLINVVFSNIRTKNTPYFLIVSELTELNRLISFKNLLPFHHKNGQKDFPLIQPEVISEGNGIIKNTYDWQKLAPIRIGKTKIEAKDNSSILVIGKLKNEQTQIPILITQKAATSNRIVLNGFNFWKWKLQPQTELQNLFDSFINNSIKWLSTKKTELIYISTTKDVYNASENIEFIANVYDETSTPINDAIVDIEISSDNFQENLKLNPSKNGVYNGGININRSGSFNYKGKITLNNGQIKYKTGKFLKSETKPENINFVLNSNYLKFISYYSSGESFFIDNYSDLFSRIEQNQMINTNDEIISIKYELWNEKWILVFIILVIAVEWTIRKKIGML